jgi:probable rRNA maturation factor
VIEPDAAIAVDGSSPAWAAIRPDAEGLVSRAGRLAVACGMIAAGIASDTPIELSIVLTDDAEQRRLNHRWRGIDRSTNVLAFNAWEPSSLTPAGAPVLLGDVVLAFETVKREAEEQNKLLADHLSHLVVHGVLHLLGYDHGTDAEAAAMETLEISILASLGVADPYRSTM